MRFHVTEQDTAMALDSGDVPVLGTPRLIAWMEAVTVECTAPHLAEDETSVGTAVHVEHLRAALVGSGVEITATLPYGVTDRSLVFAVRAVDATGRLVGAGEIVRRIVDRQRFLTGIRRRAREG